MLWPCPAWEESLPCPSSTPESSSESISVSATCLLVQGLSMNSLNLYLLTGDGHAYIDVHSAFMASSASNWSWNWNIQVWTLGNLFDYIERFWQAQHPECTSAVVYLTLSHQIAIVAEIRNPGTLERLFGKIHKHVFFSGEEVRWVDKSNPR